MQVQQTTEKNEQKNQNPFLVVSTQDVRNIGLNIIEPIYPNQSRFIQSMNLKITDKDKQIQTLKSQNTKLKFNNKQLVKQLQTFSKKLDEQLKRRSQSIQRKPKPILKPQQKQSIEVQNLYKKIQIYKKQVATLKAKLYEESLAEIRLTDYESKLKMFMKENYDLRDQIKSLNKIIKLQEKGLSDIGAEGFLKIIAENDKHKEQLRKLRLQMDQVQRKYRTSKPQILKSRQKTPIYIHTGSSGQFLSRPVIKNEFTSNKHIITRRKKNFSDYRMRTQPSSSQKQQKTQQNQSQLNAIKPYLDKIQKLQGKIRAMNSEKIRQREIIENLKIQIIQKDKQVNYLREKTQSLRKIYKPKKSKQQNSESKQNPNDADHSYLQAIDSIPSRSQTKLQNPSSQQTVPVNQIINIQKTSEQRSLSQYQLKQRYPRLQQMGSKKETSYKWNHHQFSSKIKQVQVYLNGSGYISHIHARYQKGEPNKSSQLNNKKFSALVCSKGSEYVQDIRGGFRNSHLQYLVMKTNQKRVVEFGQSSLENQCENFFFAIQEHEYPCALLGEYDIDGVLRFGCFVEKLMG